MGTAMKIPPVGILHTHWKFWASTEFKPLNCLHLMKLQALFLERGADRPFSK